MCKRKEEKDKGGRKGGRKKIIGCKDKKKKEEGGREKGKGGKMSKKSVMRRGNNVTCGRNKITGRRKRII